MKPLYIFVIMWAVFITGLADGISMSIGALPGLGIIFAFVITFCINSTMGLGLLFLLASKSMYHPKWGPISIIGGLLPGLNFLPFWIGLAAAGIAHDLSREKGLLGEVAGIAEAVQSGKNPFSRAKAVLSTSKTMRLSGRPQQEIEEGKPQEGREEKSRILPNLKSPSLAPSMGSDIAPIRNQTYAKTA